VLAKAGDLAAILDPISRPPMWLFIDENSPPEPRREEVLYPALEDFDAGTS